MRPGGSVVPMSCEQGLLQLDVVGPFSSAMPVLSRGEYSLDTIGLILFCKEK